MAIVKTLINVALFVTMIIGIVMMITEIPETESTVQIIKVNGGGALMFCVSLLLLSVLNREDETERRWE